MYPSGNTNFYFPTTSLMHTSWNCGTVTIMYKKIEEEKKTKSWNGYATSLLTYPRNIDGLCHWTTIDNDWAKQALSSYFLWCGKFWLTLAGEAKMMMLVPKKAPVSFIALVSFTILTTFLLHSCVSQDYQRMNVTVLAVSTY